MSTLPFEGVGIIGATGPMGGGLAIRLGMAGIPTFLGSRTPERAAEAAEAIKDQLGATALVQGGSNAEAASYGELVLLTIPYQPGSPLVGQLGELLQGRVLVSTAAPMEFRAGVAHPIRPEAGSAAQEVESLCPGALLVGAFHTVSAPTLARIDSPLDEDVIVTSDHPVAKALVIRLIDQLAGLRPVDGGGLANAGFTEGLTPLLIRLNRLHHTNTGVKITGIATP